MGTETIPRKIKSIKIQNFQKISLVDVEFDNKGVIKISGKNGAGKSSFFDALAVAIGGTRLNPDKPIKNGKQEGMIEVVLDNGFKITRKWLASGNSTINIKKADGKKISETAPEYLKKIVGKLTIDPLKFSNMTNKEQAEIILGMIDLKIDLDDLAKRRKEFYEDRSKVNTLLKNSKGLLNCIKCPEEDELIDEVSISGLISERDEKSSKNTAKETQKELVKRTQMEEKELLEKVKQCEKDLKLAQKSWGDKKVFLSSQEVVFSEMPEFCINEITEQISGAESFNKKVREVHKLKEDFNQAQANVEKFSKESKEFDSKIAAIDKQKEDAFKDAKMPIKGMSIDETGLIVNGTPFSQECTSAKIKISALIAMKMNPGLEFMMIRQGNDLDQDNWKILERIAEKNDYQIFIETIIGGENEILIENGVSVQ